MSPVDPRTLYPTSNENFGPLDGTQPGLTDETYPKPDHGEDTYRGHNRLTGQRALITGGDSGIGRAVAIAYAREGADVAFTFLPEEEEDAFDTAEYIRAEGRIAVPLASDLRSEARSRAVVHEAAEALGGLDTLVCNAGYQKNRESLNDLTTEELRRVFDTNIFSRIWTLQEAQQYLQPGSAIIITASIQAFQPSPVLFDYAATKAAQVSLVQSLAQFLGPKGIRVNAVAPGPIWTPLIPATGWPDNITTFGGDTPLGRPGQPAELAGAYVYLASPEASYVSGAVLPVTGGKNL